MNIIREEKGMMRLIKKYPFISAVVFVELLTFVTYFYPGIPFANVGVRVVLCAALMIVLHKCSLESALQFQLSSFARGLLIGLPFFLFAIWIAFNNMRYAGAEGQIDHIIALWDFCARMLMIGIFEELSYRGLLLNVYLQHREKTRSTIYMAVFWSSLIFGITHYLNLLNEPFSGTAFLDTSVSVFSAFCTGVFLAAVYLKSMNIWVSVFLHAVWDFANLFPDPSFFTPHESAAVADVAEQLSTGEILGNAALSMIEPTLILLIGVFILRNINKTNYIKSISNVFKK